MGKKRKKKPKYWFNKPVFYNTQFLIVVYVLCMILSWSVLFTLPMNCETVNQTSFFAEGGESYMVQSCTSIMGNAVRVVYFK